MPTHTVPKRFRIAFSFAGEKRSFVEKVANILASKLGKEAILYDKFHEAEFARPDLGLILPALYSKYSELIVPVLCPAYNTKQWTGWEWAHIFGLLTHDDGYRVMPSRFERAIPEGLSPVSGFIELDDKSPEDFAALILERLAINEKTKVNTRTASTLGITDTYNVHHHFPSEVFPCDHIPSQEFSHSSSAEWFSSRFKRAFPGVRNEVRWLDDPCEAINRLQRLLAAPLEFPGYQPAWWFRGGSNNPITVFRVLDANTILLDSKELEVDRIAAIDCGQYWNHAVYLQAKAVEPSGADQAAITYKSTMIAKYGYCDEETCFFEGKYLKRSFLDDGAAEIDGKVVDLNEAAEVRYRYLSPYNLLIAAHDSAINNPKFDNEQEELMKQALTDASAVSTLAKKIATLPKQVMYFA